MEVVVLAIVGLIVLGPDRLPGLTRDAARLIRSLRDMATGARQQLRDELGPEFADVDLRTLNPRTAVQRAIFGDEINLSKLNPRTAMRDAILGDEDLRAADPRASVREAADVIRDPAARVNLDKSAGASSGAESGASSGAEKRVSAEKRADRPRPSPRPRQAPSTPYDNDAT
jgi:sec-independent protein translocase protein TatB